MILNPRVLPIALCVLLNPVDIHGRQSACKVYMMSSQPFISAVICTLSLQTIPSVLGEWPAYKAGKTAGSRALESSFIGFPTSLSVSDLQNLNAPNQCL